ncbi:MAG: dTDP-glucose 4,6-dehydratase [Bdellovibrionota bacterium]
MSRSMKRVLVTGSAGFIGSAFVRMLRGLSGKEYSVEAPELLVGLDAFRIGSSKDSYAMVPDFEMIEGDIGDTALLAKLQAKYAFDTVINFAAESHVDRSIEDSSAFVHSNVLGVVSLLEFFKDKPLRFVQVSTDEVYGSLGDKGAFTESSQIEPNSPYSASKAASDLFVRAFVHTHKMDAVVTRCSNNYGPYQFPEKFIPVIISKALKNEKIPVYGSGKNVRDWIYVEDHCWGVYLAATQGKMGEVYNFGGHGECENLVLAKKILEHLGKGQDLLSFVEDRKGHDWRYFIDSKKAEEELSWNPQWKFEEALQFTVQWYVDNLPKWNLTKGDFTK